MTQPQTNRWLDQVIFWGLVVQIITLPLRHTDTILAAAYLLPLLALVARCLLAWRSQAKEKDLPLLSRLGLGRTPLDLPLLIFLVVAVVSTFYSVDPLETLDEIRADIIVPGLLFYLAAWGLRDRSQIVGLGKAVVVIMGVLSAYGIIHFFAVGGRLDSYAYREASLARDYHFLGTYLVTALPLALVMAVSAGSRIWRRLALGAALAASVTIYVTHDRGCWLALGLIVICLYPFFTSRRKPYIIGLAAVALAVALFLPPKMLIHGQKAGIFSGQEIETNTISQRFLVWSFCIDCVKEQPFSGTGFGRHNFQKAFPDFYKQYKRFQLWHCHSTYLDFAVQMGLVGLAAFIFLIYRSLRMTHSIWRRAGPGRLWGAAGLVALIAFLARVLWDSFYVDEHVRLLWLILGIAFAAWRLEGGVWPKKG